MDPSAVPDQIPHTTYPFGCAVRFGDELVVVTVSGEIDLATAPTLQQVLHDAVAARPRCVVMDFRGVDFIDSSGLQAIVVADHVAQARGVELAVRGASPKVTRVFELVGLDRYLSFDPAATLADERDPPTTSSAPRRAATLLPASPKSAT